MPQYSKIHSLSIKREVGGRIQMASFKLNIANPKEGKCYKTEVKDEHAAPLMGVNIGEKVDGSKLGFEGFEFEITGGTDYCGFPMRKGILGVRKKLTIHQSVGFKGKIRGKKLHGMRKRNTICGHKINDKISAVNLKVSKEGSKKIADVLGGGSEAKEGEAPKEEAKKAETKSEEKK